MLKIKLKNYQIVFIAIGLIGVLLFASPTIALLLKLPPDQEFSEIYLLGPDHTLGTIPFNITAGVPYLIYLGVGNYLGSSNYYRCLVKTGNETESLPNVTNGTSSMLPSLYEYNTFIDNGATWETPLTFQVKGFNFANEASQLSEININGIDYSVNKTSVWDSSEVGYYYNLIVELWSFNSTMGILQFDNRYVSLELNVTE